MDGRSVDDEPTMGAPAARPETLREAADSDLTEAAASGRIDPWRAQSGCGH
jgi:hypothetical protein